MKWFTDGVKRGGADIHFTVVLFQRDGQYMPGLFLTDMFQEVFYRIGVF